MQWPWPKPKRSRSHKTFKGQSTHAHVCTYELKLWWGYIYILDQKVSLVSSTGQLLEEFMPRRVVCVYLCATVNNCSFTQVLLSNVYQTLNTVDRYPWELCSFLVFKKKRRKDLLVDIFIRGYTSTVLLSLCTCRQCTLYTKVWRKRQYQTWSHQVWCPHPRERGRYQGLCQFCRVGQGQ